MPVSNMGRDDRLFRCALGLILLQLVVTLDGWGRLFGLTGVLPLVVGLTGWSPLYAWLRIATSGPAEPENVPVRLVTPMVRASYDAA